MAKSNEDINVNNSLIKTEESDDTDSNATEIFDFENFKATSLNEKYSVHNNDVELLEDFNRIMGVDGDDPDATDANRMLNHDVSGSTNEFDRTKKAKDTDMGSKDDYVTQWLNARPQSQSLSQVANILCDHDYLSQENLRGIINGNEQNSEIQQKQNESMNASIDEDSIDQKTYNEEIVEEFSAICNKISTAKLSKQQKEMIKSRMQLQLVENSEIVNSKNTDAKPNDTCSTDFSPDHSEPLEYYGNYIPGSSEQSSGKFK